MRSILYYIVSKIKKLQSKDTEIDTDISGIKQDITDINGDITILQEKNYIITGLSANTDYTTSFAYGSELISLDSEILKNGNVFELITTGDNTGKIKVNKDCFIKINANIMLSHPNDKQSIIGIFKNNDKLTELCDSTPSGTWITNTFSSYIIQVSKDDLIYFTFGSNDSSVNIRIAKKGFSYFTIEEYK